MRTLAISVDPPFCHGILVKKGLGDLKCLEAFSCEQLPEAFTSSSIITGLSAQDLLLYKTNLPKKGRSTQMQKALLLRAETEWHIPPQELVLAPMLDLKTREGFVYGTTKQALRSHLNSCEKQGFDPEFVTTLPEALSCFIHTKDPQLLSYFLIHIGWSEVHCLWVEAGKLERVHSLNKGLEMLYHLSQKDKAVTFQKLGSPMNFSFLQRGSHPKFLAQMYQWRLEITQILASFGVRRPWVLLGEGDRHEGLRAFLKEGIQEQVAEEKVLIITPEENQYAACLGLAYLHAACKKNHTQFRIGSWTAKRTWRRIGKGAFALASISLLAAGSLYGILRYRIEEMQQNISSYFCSWASKGLFDSKLRTSFVEQPLFTQLEIWRDTLNKSTFDPFYLRPPLRLTSFLSWLSQWQKLEDMQVRYELLSYPHLDATKEPYRGKIELLFKGDEQSVQEFQETLRKRVCRNNLSSKEIIWKKMAGTHHVSFVIEEEDACLKK